MFGRLDAGDGEQDKSWGVPGFWLEPLWELEAPHRPLSSNSGVNEPPTDFKVVSTGSQKEQEDM